MKTRSLALLPILLLTACTHTAAANSTGAGTTGPAPGGGVVVAEGHGWTKSGLEGPMPAPGTCHLRKASDGEPLPDPSCTPGAVDSTVTDADIATTICRKGGYTASVRPPESLTNPAKKKLLAAYGIPVSQIGKYELDHLVELASGGASDVRNLWPEPNTFRQFRQSAFVHNDKDAVEAYTFHAICARKVTSSAVEKAMATNWTTAVSALKLPPIPASYKG